MPRPRGKRPTLAERARLAVLISGRGSNMAALLYASRLPDCPFEIVLVASNVPDAAGLTLAAAEGVPTFAHDHRGLKRADFDKLIDAELTRAGATHVALAGYMRLLSDGFVERWAGRMVNIHPSLLPAHKGLDVHEGVHRRMCQKLGATFGTLNEFQMEHPAYMTELGCYIKTLQDAGLKP